MDTNTIEFIGDDLAYLQWLHKHPSGYVLNTERSKNPNYMVLHGAWCQYINGQGSSGKPGRFTERDYIKICSTNVQSLRGWVRDHGRPSGSFSSEECYCLST